jgi:hypothetical protein
VQGGAPADDGTVGLVETQRAYEAIRAIIGVRATVKLMRARGGTRLYVPSLQAFRRADRDRRIVEALRPTREYPKGPSYARVARMMRISKATVIRAGKRASQALAGLDEELRQAVK